MTEMVYREALKAGLREEMLRDERVFLLGEDIGLNWGGAFKVTKGLAEEFGVERVRDTPISENTILPRDRESHPALAALGSILSPSFLSAAGTSRFVCYEETALCDVDHKGPRETFHHHAQRVYVQCRAQALSPRSNLH